MKFKMPAIVLIALLLPQAVHACGRSCPSPSIYVMQASAGPSYGIGYDIAAEAARYVGSGKLTQLPGAWCADAVSFWLRATGHQPLATRMAGAALSYGQVVSTPARNDLVVMRTRHGAAGHVGVVESVSPSGLITYISGNYAGHVARATIAPGAGLVFVRI